MKLVVGVLIASIILISVGIIGLKNEKNVSIETTSIIEDDRPEINHSEMEKMKETVDGVDVASVESRNEIIAENKKEPVIVDRLVNFGFEKSNHRKIDAVIIHSSYDALGNDPYSVIGIMEEYRQYQVSPHYLIDRKGIIYRLVADKDIAYHAGTGMMPDGRDGINKFSIGIELINTKTDDYTNKQYQSLNQLLDKLKNEYSIKYILGHNQIAPERKSDPWNFQWNRINKT